MDQKIKKLEQEIKELNALKADYRREFEDSEKALAKKEISQPHFDRIKRKYEDRVSKINEKIVDRREEMEKLRKAQ